MSRTGWIAAAMAGLVLAGSAQAQTPAKEYDPLNKDPCSPVMKKYCAEPLAQMDHTAIHACLLAHDDQLTNACRMNMNPPRPPLRPEGGASTAPISTPAKGG